MFRANYQSYGSCSWQFEFWSFLFLVGPWPDLYRNSNAYYVLDADRSGLSDTSFPVFCDHYFRKQSMEKNRFGRRFRSISLIHVTVLYFWYGDMALNKILTLDILHVIKQLNLTVTGQESVYKLRKFCRMPCTNSVRHLRLDSRIVTYWWFREMKEGNTWDDWAVSVYQVIVSL